MMRADADVAVYVCVTPVDMRKQATTLALIVEQALKRDIFEAGLYAFSNARCGASIWMRARDDHDERSVTVAD
jgi:hypothetical protein